MAKWLTCFLLLMPMPIVLGTGSIFPELVAPLGRGYLYLVTAAFASFFFGFWLCTFKGYYNYDGGMDHGHESEDHASR